MDLILYGLLGLFILWQMNKTAKKTDNNSDSYVIAKDSRAVRNNNPGNLKYAGQSGATGKDQDGFAIFENPEAGFNALYNQILLDSNRGHTLKSFITKYSPPSENPTNDYINFLVEKLGIKNEDIKLEELEIKKLADNMAKFEGYYV